MHRPKPNEAQKRKMRWQRGRSCKPSPAHCLPAKRESKPAVSFSPTETLRDRRQPDGMRRPDAQPIPSPSPQQPRPMTSLTSLQLWLNKPKIDQRDQDRGNAFGKVGSAFHNLFWGA
jgi:hypothetical protein